MDLNLPLVIAPPEFLLYEYSQGLGIATRHAQRNPRWWPNADTACKVSIHNIIVGVDLGALTICLTSTSLYSSPACPALRQANLQAFQSHVASSLIVTT